MQMLNSHSHPSIGCAQMPQLVSQHNRMEVFIQGFIDCR